MITNLGYLYKTIGSVVGIFNFHANALISIATSNRSLE